MPHRDEGSELHAVIRRLCEEHRDTPSLSPSWLAMEAMQRIGFDRQIHGLGWIGCNLQFRQIARAYCRKHFDPAERVQQAGFFPDTLQERYPLPPVGDAEHDSDMPMPDLLHLCGLQESGRSAYTNGPIR